jgi:hypothetical protein
MPNGTGNTVMFAPFLSAPIAVVPPTFLSFNFDWNVNRTQTDAWTNASVGWTLDLRNERLIALAKALSPANLRVGGSLADDAEYQVGGHNCSASATTQHVCLTMARWHELVSFCQQTGLRLVFDLNIMRGRSSDPTTTTTGTSSTWDSANALALIQHTQAQYPVWSANRDHLAFELGNEKEFALTPVETAIAFLQLRKVKCTAKGRQCLCAMHSANVFPFFSALYRSWTRCTQPRLVPIDPESWGPP